MQEHPFARYLDYFDSGMKHFGDAGNYLARNA
jgi:hypothetical protein